MKIASTLSLCVLFALGFTLSACGDSGDNHDDHGHEDHGHEKEGHQDHEHDHAEKDGGHDDHGHDDHGGGHMDEGEKHDLGTFSLGENRYRLEQIGEVAAGKREIVVNVMALNHTPKGTLTIAIGDESGNALAAVRQLNFRAMDGKEVLAQAHTHIELPKELPLKPQFLITHGDATPAMVPAKTK